MTMNSLGSSCFSVLVTLLLLAGEYTQAFSSQLSTTPGRVNFVLYSTQATTPTTLPGVPEFEKWFQSSCKNDNDTMGFVKHAVFPSTGRGLQFIHPAAENNAAVITLPKELVLQSTMVEDKTSLKSVAEDWDCVLAMQLLNEWKRGTSSKVSGYCSLLTQGQGFEDGTCPPSTAPDCIRNWTPEQVDVLKQSTRGERLVTVQEKQANEWTEKYNALSSSDRQTFTREQFVWAMEAVHSRAFKGDFAGNGGLAKVVTNSLIPFAVTALGLNYVRENFGTEDSLTLPLIALSCAPVFLSLAREVLGGSSGMDAVLLPFIDSANHLENAQSTIEFDPLKGAFTVSMEGTNCIVDEASSGTQQFYISYGKKLDTELLLNYGFLPNQGVDKLASTEDERRRNLAETFNAQST